MRRRSRTPRALVAVTSLAAIAFAGPSSGASPPLPPAWTSLGPVGTPDLLAGFVPGSVAQEPSTTYGLRAAGEVTAVAVDTANPLTMYVGAGGGFWWGGADSQAGLFKTTDGGQTWRPVVDGLDAHTVLGLWLDRAAPATVVAATTAGLYRTTSAGTSWTREAAGSYRRLVSSGSTLYAGGDSGLEVSTNDGATWTPVPGAGQVTALGAGGGTVVVGEFDGVVLSGSGTAFTQVYSPPPSAPAPHWSQLVVDPSTPSRIYGSDPVAGSVFESTDGGATCNAVALPSVPSLGTFSVRTVALDAVDPNVVYVGGDETLDCSTDGGRTFTALAVGVDLWGITPSPAEQGAFLATTDQGLYSVSQEGAHWTSLNGDLSTSLIQSVAVEGSTVLARAQDFSIIASYDGGSSWQMLTGAGGENGELLANPANPQYVYGMGTADGLTYSTDGGHTWSDAPSVPAVDYTSGNQVFAVDPAEPSRVYVATTRGVYVSSDWGRTWAPAGWPYTDTDLVAVDPSNSMHIIVGTHGSSVYPQNGSLYESDDGGATWTQISSPEEFVSSVAFAPGGLYLGGTAGVVVRAPGAASFSARSTGLPTLPTSLDGTIVPGVIALTTAQLGGRVVLVASTSDGVFALDDHGRWVDLSGDLMSRIVWQFTTSGANAYVATYGEGVATTSLASLAAYLNVAENATRPTAAALSVDVTTPSGVTTPSAGPGDSVVATLTPPPGITASGGACVLLAGRRRLPGHERRSAAGVVSCRWSVPLTAVAALHGWIEVRSGSRTLRRAFSVP